MYGAFAQTFSRVDLEKSVPLPAEILADIFVFSLQGSAVHLKHGPCDAPWTFLRVNSRWRQVALSEHRLWNALIADTSITSTQAWLDTLWVSPGSQFLVSLDLSGPSLTIDINRILPQYSSRLVALSIKMSSTTIFEVMHEPPLVFENLEAITLRLTGKPLEDNLPVLLFSGAPRLHTIQMVGDRQSISDSTLRFPWRQLTTLRLTKVFYPLAMISSMLSQCPRLIHFEAATGWSRFDLDDLPAMKPIHDIFLPDLQELTYVVVLWMSLDGFFNRLKMPSLKNLAIRGEDFSPFSSDHESLYPFPQAEFLAMLEKSTRIETLTLGFKLPAHDLGAVLRKTPSLTTLLISMVVPGDIFDMMGRGALLPKLGRLECKTTSLYSFLDLLEEQCSYVDPRGYCGIHTAHIMYPCIGDMSSFSRRLKNLKPILRMDGKKIIFKAGSLSGKFFLRSVRFFFPRQIMPCINGVLSELPEVGETAPLTADEKGRNLRTSS